MTGRLKTNNRCGYETQPVEKAGLRRTKEAVKEKESV